MDEVLKRNNIGRALNLKDLQEAAKRKGPVVIQSVEGGHFLEGKIERLQLAYKRGLRHLGLLHDNDASVPLGDVYTNPPHWGGLSPFGVQVIKECNRLGILIDLTHCSNDAIDAALKLSGHPVVISHTGLDTQLGQNADMARMMKPRLISTKQAKIVADAGGVIGVWTHLSDSVLEYAQNIRAMVDVVGVDHVCIGTDTKMTPSYRPGVDPNKVQPRIGERTNGAWKDQKEGFYPTVTEALRKTGFTDVEIGKISGGNYLRIFATATA
jgi:membrane dipeptidase